MTYPINVTIPNANHYPGDDQPGMQTNFANINTYLQIDHTDPAASGAGTHKQVTFLTEQVPAGLTTDPASIIYSGTGSASTNAELYYVNADARFLLSCVKAFGYYTVSGSTITAQNVYNIATAVRSSTGVYVFTFTTNAVKSANYSIFVTSGTRLGSISQTSTNFTVTFVNVNASANQDPSAFSVQVLQY